MFIMLDWREWLEDVHVRRFEDDTPLARTAAQLEAEALPANRTAFIFDTSHPLQQEIESAWMNHSYGSAKLVEIYNALVPTADRVKCFHDRDTAFRRIALKLVQRAESIVKSVIPQPQARNIIMSDAVTETKAEAKERVKAEKAAAREAKKAEKAAAPKAEKGPGVISTLVDMLKNGGGTVDEMYAKLAEAFPARAGGLDEKGNGGMKTTIRVQLVRLAKQGKLNISKEKVEGRGLIYTGSAVE